MKTGQKLARKITDNQYTYQIRHFDTIESGVNMNYVDVYVKLLDNQQNIYVGSYYIHEQEVKDDAIMSTYIQYNHRFVAIVSKINGNEHCVKLYDVKRREVYRLSESDFFDYKKYLHVTKNTFQGFKDNTLYQHQQKMYQELSKEKTKTWKLEYKKR